MRRNQLDKIIITAMDRFVWFILLVVTSHLVTEFTRVTGYARGPRRDVDVINDTLIHPVNVQNMLLYPGQDYGLYERPIYTNNGNGNANSNNLNNNNNNNNNNNVQENASIISPNGDTSFPFSLRPIIDSIFDIPISTLHAVNNLVARLTGSYQKPGAQSPIQSAASIITAAINSAARIRTTEQSTSSSEEVTTSTQPRRNSLLRELSA